MLLELIELKEEGKLISYKSLASEGGQLIGRESVVCRLWKGKSFYLAMKTVSLAAIEHVLLIRRVHCPAFVYNTQQLQYTYKVKREISAAMFRDVVTGLEYRTERQARYEKLHSL